MAFNVITNVTTRALRRRGLRMLQYVDDGLGVSLAAHAEREQRVAESFCRDLLGPDAIAKEKSESGRKLEFIGYEVDLRRGSVSLSRRNRLRSLHAFLTADLDGTGTMPVRELQKLAALAMRYAAVCQLLRPFVNVIFGAFKGAGESPRVLLDPRARVVLRLFRHFLLREHFEGLFFYRTIDSFAQREATWVLEVDACLTGIGVIGFKVVGGVEVCSFYACEDISALGFKEDSSFQNTAEFLGVIIAVVTLLRFGVEGEPLAIRGDSRTALCWAASGRPKGSLAMRAGIVWAYLLLRRQINVVDHVHIPNNGNVLADALSRGASWSETLELDADSRLEAGAQRVNIPHAQRWIALCDPSLSLDSDGAVSELVEGVEGLMQG